MGIAARIVMSGVIGAMVPAAVFATVLAFHTDSSLMLSTWFTVFGVFSAIAFAHFLVFGLLVLVWLEERNKVRWWTCAISGALIGGLPVGSLYVALADVWAEKLDAGLYIGGFAGGLGFIGGLAAWVSWRFLPSVRPLF